MPELQAGVGQVRKEFAARVRKLALDRARWRCERCGSPERLQVHHVSGASDRSLFNALVLCEPCHAEEHRARPGWKARGRRARRARRRREKVEETYRL